MGKLNDSLLSGSTGRTGRLVVANVGGVEVLRVRPKKSTKPPSTKQLLIQERMKQCYDFIIPYKAYASTFFGYKFAMRSRYNLAISNLLKAFKLQYDSNTIIRTYPEIDFSQGSLLTVIPTGLLSDNPQELKIDWRNNSGGNATRETDLLQVLVVGEEDKRPIFLEDVAKRLVGTVSIMVPPNFSQKTVHVWLAFKAADLSSASNSVYVGTITVL